ncbi:MAG: acyl carrier protein [Nevskia sp.]
MDKQKILAEIGAIIADVLDVSGLNLTMDTTAEDVEGWDSFNHINIVVAVEEHFRVKMNTAEIEELRNVGGFVELIEKKLASS